MSMCERGTCSTRCSPGRTGTPRTLPELIARLHELIPNGMEKADVEEVRKVMEAFPSDRKNWHQYDYTDPHRYTRNLVDEGNGHFNLILLCWPEGQGSSIHSHAKAHCMMKIVQGELKEEQYQWPDSGTESQMKKKREFTHTRDQVAYINDDIGLHRVENPSHSERAVSLHLYSPPFQECDSFDQRTGHPHKVTMTFWSKKGKLTPEAIEAGAQPFPEDK